MNGLTCGAKGETLAGGGGKRAAGGDGGVMSRLGGGCSAEICSKGSKGS